MTLLHIDFAPRSMRRKLALMHPLTWFALCIGGLLCMTVSIKAINLLQQKDVLQAKIKYLETQLVQRISLRLNTKKFTLPEAQAVAVNNAVAQLNLPWREVLDAIEAATPATVALLALEPDAKKQFIKGTAEAKTSDGMLAYIEQIKQQPFFRDVLLTKHEINEQDPNKPIRFQFQAQWTEAAQ